MKFRLELAAIEEIGGKTLYTYNIYKVFLWGILFIPVYSCTDISKSNCRRCCRIWFLKNYDHARYKLEYKKNVLDSKTENTCSKHIDNEHYAIEKSIKNRENIARYIEDRLYVNHKGVYPSLRLQAFSKYNELIVQDENGVTFDINKNERLAYERGLEDAYKDILKLLNR